MALRAQIVSLTVKQLAKTNYIPVRYRKPRWVPKAKSKEFYVRKPTPIIPEEYNMLNVRYSQYRAEVKSIRQFLQQQYQGKEMSLSKQQVSDDANDLIWMEEEVLKWNKSVAGQRSTRQAEEIRQEEVRVKELERTRAEAKLQDAIKAEEKLQKLIEQSSEFISSANKDRLDAAIEKLLDSRTDYNFALTKSGEILRGEFPEKPAASN